MIDVYDRNGNKSSIMNIITIDVDLAINDTISLNKYGFGSYDDNYVEHKIIFAFARNGNELHYGIIGGLKEIFTMQSSYNDITLELTIDNTLRYVGNSTNNPNMRVSRIVIIY